MKNLKYIIILLLAVSFSSCDDWIDVNENPNSATTVDPDYLFSMSTTAFSANRTTGDGYLPLGFGSQLWSSGQLWGQAGDFYVFSPYSIGNNWSICYSDVGKNLSLGIDIAREGVPVRKNAIAQMKIFMALSFFQTSALFGDIPMSESFNRDILMPAFDPQKQVFEQVIDLLDEAIDSIDVASAVPAITSNDLFYKGDMGKWLELAKSLKFRTYFFLVDQDPSYSSDIVQMLNAGGMVSSSAGDLVFPYFDEAGNRHPLFVLGDQYYGPDGIDDMFLTPPVYDIMVPNNDPRLPKYYRFGEDEDGNEVDYYEAVAASERATTDCSYFNAEVLAKPDQGDFMFTYSEQKYLEAEAYVRFEDDLTGGEAAFKDGLAAALERYEVSSDIIVNFVGKFTFEDKADALKTIYEQHWIDMIDRPYQGFATWRRSGDEGEEIPALTKPTYASTAGLLRRWNIPEAEMNSNDNAPDPNPDLDEKMWFDK
jgi:hypothetical protein